MFFTLARFIFILLESWLSVNIVVISSFYVILNVSSLPSMFVSSVLIWHDLKADTDF